MKIYLAGKMTKWRQKLDLRGHTCTGPDETFKHNRGRHGDSFDLERDEIVRSCLGLIGGSDAVFAWISSLDAYGAFAEIGYAVSDAVPVYLAIATPVYAKTEGRGGATDYEGNHWHLPDGQMEEGNKDARENDLWFLMTMARESAVCDDPQVAFDRWFTPPTFVYFMEAVGLDRIKIGYSDNPEKRLSQLSTGSPVPLRILKKIPGDKQREQELHARFDGLRLDGEWFHAAKDLRSFIATV